MNIGVDLPKQILNAQAKAQKLKNIKNEYVRGVDCHVMADVATVGNKMHKAFPLPVMEFPLSEEVPTVSEESFHCQTKRDATVEKIALLLKSSKFGDSYEAPKDNATTCSTSDGTGKKKGMIVTLTTDEMQKRKNDVKVIVSHLEFMDIEIEHDDLNQKFLTSLPPEWLIHMIVWRNRSDLDTMSLDDLYNHLKVYESEVHKKSESNSYNMAFISLAKHNNENEEVNTASVFTASTNVSTASANIKAASISQDTACAYIASQSSETPTEFTLMAKTSTESEVFDNSLCSKASSKDLDSLLKSQRLNKNKEGLRYSDVPPPPAQVYSPPKKDLSWTGLSEFADDTITDYSRPTPTIESPPDDAQNRNPSVTKTEASPSTISPKPFIKFVRATDRSTKTKTAKVETAKPTVKYAVMYSKPSKSSKVRGNQRNWNNLKSHQLGANFVMKKKACYNCGLTILLMIVATYPTSLIMSHLIEDMCLLVKEDERLLAKELSKPVLKNKKDERWIVIRNKARLVAQGHTLEEGIDYDEVFAPVARIKAIRLFLAYASLMGFTVYQMDMKSAFLYGTIDEEVYVMQPPRFQDLEFPARVYKVEKAMYGLHQALRVWQRGDFILVHVYVDDIIFGSSNLQLCREFEALMHEKFQMIDMVKRIFRYLKGHPKLRLRYPKESPFDLVAYSDSDYGGASQDHKSTTGGCQFLGRRLISWQCKKQTIVAISTTEVEYVAAIEHAMRGFVKGNLIIYTSFVSHTVFGWVIGTSKYWGVLRILMISLRLIPLFWSTARIETTEEGTKILATVDGKLRTVFESSIRRNLKLNDEAGISSLPDAELFENLQLIGYNILPNQKFTFQKGQFSYEPASLIRDDSQGEACPTDSVLAADQDRANIAKTSTLPSDSTPRVTSLATDEGKKDLSLTDQFGDDAPIKGRRLDEGEEAAERVSDDTKEMATVLTSMDAASILTSGGVQVVPTAVEVATATISNPTGSGVVSTASLIIPIVAPIFTTAIESTPYTRRKGKEKMVESDTPKKKKLQEQIDVQGEGSGTPTESHHTPTSEASQSSQHQLSSPSLLPVPTAPLPTVIPTDITSLRHYTRRARIAQSLTLPPIADEPASLIRDDS
nr:hypothetical protein [Tanacetum cinerariifolium]